MSDQTLPTVSIADFPETPRYTIKSVSAQTGIRPVTLRAWERRYEILEPFRSENKYRLYSDRDVAILRWIKSRVDSGVSISTAVSELKAMQQNGIYPPAVPTFEPATPRSSSEPPAHYARQLYRLLIKHDEAGASDLLREAQAVFELGVTFEEVIIPCLVDIGMAWYTGEIRITTEHFASNFIRGKLLTLFQAFPTRRSAAYVLVGCAPTEQHELGGLMYSVLLRQDGCRVEFLGPDTPIEDLVEYARYENPAMIVLTATTEAAAGEMKDMQARVSRLRPTPIFAYAGPIFVSKPSLRAQIPGIYLGDSIIEAARKSRELLK